MIPKTKLLTTNIEYIIINIDENPLPILNPVPNNVIV